MYVLAVRVSQLKRGVALWMFVKCTPGEKIPRRVNTDLLVEPPRGAEVLLSLVIQILNYPSKGVD
jgi:hypothetical protein